MLILDNSEVLEIPGLIAGADDRYFLLKLHKCLEHSFVSAHRGKRRLDVVRRSKLCLPFAVVSKARGLEHSGKAEFVRRAVKIVDQLDVPKWRNGKAVLREES